jgi:hypothetical protein
VTLGDRVVVATVVRDRDTVWIAIDGEDPPLRGRRRRENRQCRRRRRTPRVTAPMPGKVLAVRVEVGQPRRRRGSLGDPRSDEDGDRRGRGGRCDGEGSPRSPGAMIEPVSVLVVLDFT